jgi:hypothetical protein
VALIYLVVWFENSGHGLAFQPMISIFKVVGGQDEGVNLSAIGGG